MSQYDMQKEIDYWHELASSYEQTIVKLSKALADVRENVHGEWISTKTNVYPACYTIRCSVCNFIAFYSGIEDNNKDCGYNFCPNCGADMRKGENNDKRKSD